MTKITNFGVFIGLEDGLEGLLHISELADHKVDNPEEIVKVGADLEVKILRVDTEERKIGLSKKRVDWTEEQHAEAEAAEKGESSGSAEVSGGGAELKGGIGDSSGPLIQTAPAEEAVAEEAPAAEEAVAEEAPAVEEVVAEEAPAEETASEESASDEEAEKVAE